MKPDQLIALTVTDAAAAIKEGRTTSLDLTAALLDRISERDGEIVAWAGVDRDKALADARRADEIRGFGHGTGPLHGVPIGIKDIIDTRAYPTQMGCPLYRGNQPTADAQCVASLKSAGAIVLGKTVTTELALLTPAPTRNPRDPQRSPGGSSAGSAAAVADNMVPAALGSQTAGSVLRPASYCGIYGFKPTFGLISRRGVLMQSHTLDTLGLFARSIEDIALLTDCMSAHDPDDPVSYERSHPHLATIAAENPPLPPTFAFIKTPSWDAHASAELQAAYGELIDALGNRVQEIDIPGLDNVIEWQRIVQLAENAAYYGPLQDHGRDQLSRGLNDRLDEGAAVSVRDYITAISSRDKACRAIAEVFDAHSAILTPAAPGIAPPVSEGITGAPIFNGLWTYLGMPALSLPLLDVNGLPLGVQLVGNRRDDARLLRAGRWLARHIDDLAAPSTAPSPA